MNQLVISPGAAIRHEMYHLLGCDHFDVTMSRCYDAIQDFKAREREYLTFSPTIDVAKAEPAGGLAPAGAGGKNR